MKCPRCSSSLITKSAMPHEWNQGYKGYCNECGLTGRTCDTPEAAMEAMRPIVTDEEVEFIFAMMMQAGKIYMECVMQHQIKEKGIELMKAVIKQELEKFYKEQEG